MRWLALTILTMAATAAPTPYVTVYRDEATSFQVRRDRIRTVDQQVYQLWLRWLWARPQRWKDRDEVSRVVVAHVDCARLRVRELATLHRDASGKLFDVEEVTSPEDAPWKSFAPGTGAAAAITRLCEWVPELAKQPRQ